MGWLKALYFVISSLILPAHKNRGPTCHLLCLVSQPNVRHTSCAPHVSMFCLTSVVINKNYDIPCVIFSVSI